MIIPRKFVIEFDVAMKAEYIRGLKEGRPLSWEVNVLSRLERSGFPIFHYKADHNITMFTAYKGSGKNAH
jgi:hypothetical protein